MKTIIFIGLLALFVGGAFAQEVQQEVFLHPHGPRLLPHPHPHLHLKPPHHLPFFPGKRALPPLADLPPLPPLPAGINCKNEVGNYLINHKHGSLSDECCSILENNPSPLIQSLYNQACSGGAAPTPSATFGGTFDQEEQPEAFLHPHLHPLPLPHPHPHLNRPLIPGWKSSLPPLADLPPIFPPLPPLPAGIDCKNEVGNYLINHKQGSLSDECCSLLENSPSPLVKNIYNQACSSGAASPPSA